MKDKILTELRVSKPHVPIEVMINKFQEGWCIYCYLIINWRISELMERAQRAIPTEAYKELATHLYQYVYEDVMPPTGLESVILNAADDFMKGNPVQLRAGDYIALQNYMRA